MKVSIIVPVYNEHSRIIRTLDNLKNCPMPFDKEIIVVDDGSTDGTDLFIKSFNLGTIKYKRLELNRGKGAAYKEGVSIATGDIIVPFDADLEYSVHDIVNVVMPIIEGKAKVVYGSRRLLKTNQQYSGFSYYVGGLGLTYLTNFLFHSKLTDEPNCFKVCYREYFNSLNIQAENFIALRG